MISILKSLWVTLKHLLFRRAETVSYPEEKPYLPPRYRGRIVLTRDPDEQERCVACYLCAVVCPADCIALQAAEKNLGSKATSDQRERDGGGSAGSAGGGGDASPYQRRYPEWFRINFSRCIFCGLCEEACPTYAIQLTPDFEMAEYDRNNLVYEKEDLLIDGEGKYPGYNFYNVAGIELPGKKKGEGDNEMPPVDIRSLLP